MERVKLKRLLSRLPIATVRGPKDVEITGLTANSKCVAPGNLFIAKKGLTVDGAKFIPEAIAAGATAVLTDLYNPFYPQVTQIIHPDVAAIEATLAAEFYDHPDASLFLVGITGTNGKTTVSYLVRHLLEAQAEACGLIGTIEWIVGQHVFPSGKTTPDVIQNTKLFREMVDSGCKACAMEVSSHALDQGRVQAIEFDVALFTNLTQDHLDYHTTMQTYAAAKAKLFTSLTEGKKKFPKSAVVNSDSPYCTQMTAQCSSPVIRYGIDSDCDLKATSIALTPQGTTFTLEYRGQREQIVSPLIGRFNVYNLLAAAGVGLAHGLTLQHIAAAFATFAKVPGRLEPVPNARSLPIFVDYAHTDDALLNVLKTLKEFKKGRLITVFGCGGNRDPLKRPKMGAVAEEHSDLAIITSDNPRSEDPLEIIRAILGGLKKPEEALVIPDREMAIRRAIELAQPDDVILIAGKGHETYQIFADRTIDFDDRLIASKYAH